ncbi:MAG: di-heme oxidoredictase family protein [Myxococcaceae bacterium]
MLRRSVLTLLLVSCGNAPVPGAVDSGVSGGVLAPSPASPDVPLRGATAEQLRAFRAGDAVAEHLFDSSEGLGPVYVRPSCTACHLRGGRGPATTERFAVVSSATGAPVLAAPFGSLVRPLLTAGAVTAVLAPDGGLPVGTRVEVTHRVAAPLFGRAYIEAIADGEIERVAAEQAARSDGIHGRVHRVTYHSHGSIDAAFGVHVEGEAALIGRFGVKARLATLDDVVADALQGDLGLTSRLRPAELPNPDGLPDDLLPGVDLGDADLAAVVAYTRLLDIPERSAPDARGAALFGSVGCSVCHVPSLRTRADWPTVQLAAIDAPVYSDVLLHDMGVELADGQEEEGAGSREFRTAPLIGLRYLPSYLHDGRATTLRDAVLGHQGAGSEANEVIDRFRALAPTEQDALLGFVAGL